MGKRGEGGLVGFDGGGWLVGLSCPDGFYDESFKGADLTGESFLVVFNGPQAYIQFFYTRSHLFPEFVLARPHLFSEFPHLLPERREVGADLLLEFVLARPNLLFECGELGAHLLPELGLSAFEGRHSVFEGQYATVDLPYQEAHHRQGDGYADSDAGYDYG